jgi:pimeloyl-ACP methyl ester carboxylesterase
VSTVTVTSSRTSRPRRPPRSPIDCPASHSGSACPTSRLPGGTLADTLRPVPRGDGTTDLYIAAERFHAQFCCDVPAAEAARMAVTQRPVTLEALTEPSGERPLWREVPSWFLIGEQDRTIPPALQHFTAERAGARRVVAVPGASHAITVSQPGITAELVLEAAAVPATA